jgi:hypothetical protein
VTCPMTSIGEALAAVAPRACSLKVAALLAALLLLSQLSWINLAQIGVAGILDFIA